VPLAPAVPGLKKASIGRKLKVENNSLGQPFSREKRTRAAAGIAMVASTRRPARKTVRRTILSALAALPGSPNSILLEGEMGAG
jgi:hypothetical protein